MIEYFLYILSFNLLLIACLSHKIDPVMDKLGRKKVIYSDETDEKYMIRYYIWRKPKEGVRYRNLFLHKIVRSDFDEHCHNHPWDWFTFLIKGSYKESFIDGSFKIRKRFSFRKVKTDLYHKIDLIDNEPVWSLFWHGKRKRHWGFWYQGENLYWRKYKYLKKNGELKND